MNSPQLYCGLLNTGQGETLYGVSHKMTRELSNKKQSEITRPGTAFQAKGTPIDNDELDKLGENQ